VFGIHCISLSSSGLIPYAWIPWLWPGADLIAVLTISMLLSLIHATTYAQIGSIYPRSGADYVLGSRVVHPMIQFAASFMLTVFSGLTAGALIAWIPSTVLPSFLWTWGKIYNDPGSLALSDWVGSPDGVLIVGLVFVVITFVTMILSTRVIVRILNLGFFLGILSWILMYASYLQAPGREAFIQAWNRFMGPGNYESVIRLASESGLTYQPAPPLLLALAGAIMGFWVYYGYYIPNFFAGELKEAPKTLLISGWGSLLITWLIFTVGAALLYPRLMPLEWMAAQGFLFYNTDIRAMPFSTFYANILWPNPIVVFLIMLGFVYTLVNLAMTYFFYSSRIFFAMAFDRALPDKIAYVHPKLRSPVVAMVFMGILAAIGVALSTYTVIFVQFNFVLFVATIQLIPVIAAIIYPYKRKEEFERAPSLVRFRVGGIPGLTIIGVATLIFLLWMISSTFLFPAVGGTISTLTIGWFLAFYVTGAVLFLLMRQYRLKKEGLDIMLAYKEIPPL